MTWFVPRIGRSGGRGGSWQCRGGWWPCPTLFEPPAALFRWGRADGRNLGRYGYAQVVVRRGGTSRHAPKSVDDARLLSPLRVQT